MKRQHQNAHRVMPIEPGTLAFARAEREEVLEDFFVGDDPGDQRDKHHHGGNRRQPAAPWIRHLQLEMEAVEELAAHAFAPLHLVTGLRVEGFRFEAATLAGFGWRLLPTHGQAGITGIGQVDQPTRGAGRMLLQVILRQRQARLGIDWPCGNFRLHPVTGFVVEVSQGSGQENRKQQPAEHQPGPGVQPCHGLAETLFHAKPNPRAAPEMVARITLGTSKPTHADHAVRQAKHQSTATR